MHPFKGFLCLTSLLLEQEVRLEMIGSKALTVAQSSEDNLCSPAGLASNSLGRKSCKQSSGNLVGQLIQRNVPGAMASTAGLSTATTPHHLTHHLPTTSAAIQATPPHHLDHLAMQSRSIATSTPGRKVQQHSPPKRLNNLFGVSPSDIDKYSRVVFPVCFVSSLSGFSFAH